jgi:hypothetical protein
VWLAEDRADRAVLIGSGACLFVDERDTREAHEKQATRRFSAQRRLAPGATLRGSIRLSATLQRNNAAALQRNHAAALQRNNAAASQRNNAAALQRNIYIYMRQRCNAIMRQRCNARSQP